MENKQSIWVAMVLVAIVVFAITVAAMSNKKEDKMITIPLETPTTVSDTFKTGFVEGCMDGVASKYSSCTCMYNVLEKDLGTQGLLDMSLEYTKTQQIPERLIGVVAPCFQ